MVAYVALAAAGHAAAVRPLEWGIAVDAVHLLSAGLWAGGILALALQRPPGGWTGPEGRVLLDRFTPVAIAAFLVTVGTGALRAAQELAALSDFVATSYGQILLAKIVLVTLMVPLSLVAWRRLAGSLRAEAGLTVAVVSVAALLAAYPLPPGRAEEARHTEGPSAVKSALPQEGDLTLGANAGEILLGVTVRPDRPGRNDVYVLVQPSRGAPEPSDLEVTINRGGETITMARCGDRCRTAEMDLKGGESLRLDVSGASGGSVHVDVPPLPAPPGGHLLRRANERMKRLRTYRIEETLSPPGSPILTVYAYQEPDRMHLRSSTGFETYAIRDVQYRRNRSDAGWHVSRGVPVLDVPLFAWEGFEPVTVRELGPAEIAGRRARVVSFATGDQEQPIWFRLWIDEEGLVHRMEMRAVGHFMDHRLYDFDASFSIEPPVPAGDGG